MNSVLYYPHLNPPSEWLKTAALCWDRVFTLGTVKNHRPDAISELDERLGGFLCQLDTASLGREPDVRSAFEQWLDTDEARSSLGAFESAEAIERAEDVFAMDDMKWSRDSKIFDLLRSHQLTKGGSIGERKDFVDGIPHPDLPMHIGENKISYIARRREAGLLEVSSELLLPKM